MLGVGLVGRGLVGHLADGVGQAVHRAVHLLHPRDPLVLELAQVAFEIDVGAAATVDEPVGRALHLTQTRLG